MSDEPKKVEEGVVAGMIAKKFDPAAFPLLRQMFESDVDGVIVFNMDTNQIEMVNERAQGVTGYHESELLGQSVQMLVLEALRPAHARHMEGFRRNPRRRSMGENLDIELQTKYGYGVPVFIELDWKTLIDGRLAIAKFRVKDTAKGDA